MRTTVFLALVVGLIALIGAAHAAEVVYFTNGSSMPVRSHYIKDGMIHVDMGGNALMAFPEYMVEKVVTDSQVHLPPSGGGINSGSGPMIAVGGALGGAAGEDAAKKRAAIHNPSIVDNEGNKMDTGLVLDESGQPALKPFANSDHPAKRDLAITGTVDVWNARQQANPIRPGSTPDRNTPQRAVKGQVIGGPQKKQRPIPTSMKPK